MQKKGERNVVINYSYCKKMQIKIFNILGLSHGPKAMGILSFQKDRRLQAKLNVAPQQMLCT